jgi:hypothetical protein
MTEDRWQKTDGRGQRRERWEVGRWEGEGRGMMDEKKIRNQEV